ncbi:MAG: hypothetical protein KJT03_04785 [Verrucomicrobiae bacterium]|nr:hypothetical protein [Verrucomicrobiae bacterium]
MVSRLWKVLGLWVLPSVLLAQDEPLNRMFTGLDLFSEVEGAEYQVVGFAKDRMLGTRDGKLYSMSLTSSLRYQFVPKITRRKAQLDKVVAEPFYSRYWEDFQALQATTSGIDFAEDVYNVYASSHTRSGARFSTLLTGEQASGGNPSLGKTESLAKIEAFDSLSYDLEYRLQNPEQFFDSLKLAFSLTLSHTLKNAYAVILVRFRTDNGRKVHQRPLHRVLGELNKDESRNFRFNFSGFPSGFEMEDLEFHFYSTGLEIPHQDSPGLIEMNDEDSFAYLLAKYKNGAGKPEPILFKPLDSGPVMSLISPEEVRRVKVDLLVRKDGTVSMDLVNLETASASTGLTQYLEGLRFFPAKESGRAIEARLFLPLTSLIHLDG